MTLAQFCCGARFPTAQNHEKTHSGQPPGVANTYLFSDLHVRSTHKYEKHIHLGTAFSTGVCRHRFVTVF